MNLAEKIEEIKNKPEHIRLRYVWFFVLVAMFLIIGVWIFTLKANLGKETINMDPANSLNNFSSEFSDQKRMFQSVLEESQDAINNNMEEGGM